MTPTPIPAGIRLGHLNLNVADIERSVRFYRDVLGFEVMDQQSTMALLAAGGYYHHIVVTSGNSAGGSKPAPGSTGLAHFALNYPERRDLAAALKRLLDSGWSIDAAADYSTHEAIYLHDPDFIGVELAWDRDPSLWKRGDGNGFDRRALDFPNLLAELDDPDTARYLPELAKFT
jgi:catechol 2,3-dioxygenase